MPRAQSSTANKIVEYFRSTPLEIAELVLDLAKDAVKGRKAKSEEARVRSIKAQKKAAKVATAPVPVKKRQVRRKKRTASSRAVPPNGSAPETGTDEAADWPGDPAQQ